MEEENVIIWGQDGPAMVYRSVAEQFGLKQGQRINNPQLWEQLLDEKTSLSRTACSINAAATGEECMSCGS